jgi:hypothetical protein
MSKRSEADVEVRPNSEDLSTERDLKPESSKPKKARSTVKSDRIMIFNKED